jgi:hypothetical protein
MVGWSIRGVAGDTICGARSHMIEIGRPPGNGGMTSRALPIEMIGRLVLNMAGSTAHTRG